VLQSSRVFAVEETTIIVAVILGIALTISDLWHRKRFRNRLKNILREHLSDSRWSWRTFEGLKRAIHADDQTTTDLLIDIGARPNEKEKDMWILE
jgi:hypothetical protein